SWFDGSWFDGSWCAERLDARAVDERAVPELQVHERPDGVPAVDGPVAMPVEHPFDCSWIDQAALARAAIEQHVAHDGLPAAARPLPEGNGEAHLLAREDFLRQQPANRFAQDALGREPAQLQSIRQRRG